ncbi:unnamed protein product [Ectocarpus sp. CCAP 1310/34]|nr:unnamed protein product [Ectocarpus sp. CCAP 1310/34]
MDMLFVVRRLQELGQRRKMSLCMCFVDLKKVHDSVDRELLWKVLAGAGIPEENIVVIRQIHDEMRPRVRMDDGKVSSWFLATQGVRQGCVLPPLLFNFFFTAVIEVFAIGLSADDVILENLVYLEEETGARARMLYAEDAGVVSRSTEGFARMMTVIVEVFGEFGLTVSEK